MRSRSAGSRAFLALYLLVFAGLTVPVVPWLWSGAPSLFGLPRSMVWVVALLFVMFFGLLGVYLRSGASRPETADGAGKSS